MSKFTIELTISNDTDIKILLTEPISYVYWQYEVNIILSNKDHELIIADHSLHYNMQQLAEFLEKALRNELHLHKSIDMDIGYLLNEYIKNNNGFVIKEFSDGLSAWIGYDHTVWDSVNNGLPNSTWLYNDKNNNIILEVTPIYPFFYCDIKEKPNYIPYEKWISEYTPCLATTLSHKTAQQWLDQAKYIIKTIDDNVARWKKEYEEQSNNPE